MATADIDLFLFFLEEGVNPNFCDKVSIGAVFIAAFNTTIDHLQLGKHPLFYATSCGRQNVAELLIEHGADVDLDTEVSTSAGILNVLKPNTMSVVLPTVLIQWNLRTRDTLGTV